MANAKWREVNGGSVVVYGPWEWIEIRIDGGRIKKTIKLVSKSSYH